ncbi:MAG TPA: PASTA domain-containing protein [Solirubrobacteraceae bacterium]|jgi:hypothetical protein|nr:PASTA domain-containing protein [Solirubrobacteraceae bacterium]
MKLSLDLGCVARGATSGPRRLLIAAAVCAAAFTSGSASATADSLSVSVSPNPVIQIYPSPEATVTISGMAAPQYLKVFAMYKPASSGACASTYRSDPGKQWTATFGPPQAADGSFSVQGAMQVGPETPPGAYVICAWAERADGSELGPVSTSLTVRLPKASLVIAPPLADPSGSGFKVTVTYSLETGTASIGVFSYDDFSRTHPCPIEQSIPPGSLAPVYEFVVGPGPPLSGTLTRSAISPFGGKLAAGFWRVCGYMDQANAGPLAVVATSVIVPVGSPGGKAVRCRVPNVKRKSLARARNALSAAHCRVGKVTRKTGSGGSRGTVISQSPKAGTSLPAGAKIRLVVAK